MKVLVIGATGRVGTEVVKALLQRGAAVRALTRKQPKPGAFPDAVEIGKILPISAHFAIFSSWVLTQNWKVFHLQPYGLV